ncbi:MAG TPA: c-type cytochrome [Burkholderiales bacterium]|nr:c-type cytochrome [Burkholderiales bacterium]
MKTIHAYLIGSSLLAVALGSSAIAQQDRAQQDRAQQDRAQQDRAQQDKTQQHNSQQHNAQQQNVTQHTTNVQPPGIPVNDKICAVPLGDIAGIAITRLPETISNPYAGQADAIKQGQMLFVRMNCASCHGYDASGGMGPSLRDTFWRYGGTPVDIYKSILEGRPQGMPAWGQALPNEAIWRIVAYIESLGGSFPPQYYHHAMQGDRPGENVAPGAMGTAEAETAKQ